MKTWHPSVLEHWFAAARVCDVGSTPLAVTVLNRPLALVRYPNGELAALEDRCPHRQVPLSAGRMTAQGLQCPYHGWTFAADGACTAVPGLAAGECLPQARARTVQVCERDGMLWVRLGAQGKTAPPAMVGELPPSARKFLGQLKWRAHVIDAMENFMDPLHTHTVHPGLVRSGRHARAQATVGLRLTGQGFVVDYQGLEAQSGWLFRLFESPRVSEQLVFGGAGSAQIVYRYANGSVVRITLHFTPETLEHTHVFTTLHVEQRWAPRWLVHLAVWPFLKQVARQDAAMLALQADSRARFAPARGVVTRLDLVRGILEKIWETGEPLGPEDEIRDLPMLL
ncbi:MAG TPA: aromatic ring-hydroxylating dioxygenase subunit alpha [Burkholderiaceae bacterium]